jgi:hypothetical protein
MGGFTDLSRLRRAVRFVLLGLLLLLAFGLGGGFGGRSQRAATTVVIISADTQVQHDANGSFVSTTNGELLAAR